MAEVVLQCEDKTFTVNKRRLSEASTYFNAMFNSGFLESNAPSVTISNMDASILEILLEGINQEKYKKFEDLDFLCKVLETANFFDFTKLVETYRNYVLLQLSLQTLGPIWDLAERISDTCILEAVEKFLIDIVKPPFNYDRVMDFPMERLMTALDLAKQEEWISSAETLKCIVEWIRYDIDERVDNIDSLLTFIDFQNIPSYYLRHLLINSLVVNSTKLEGIITSVLEERGSPVSDIKGDRFGLLYPHFSRVLMHEVNVNDVGNTTLEMDAASLITRSPCDVRPGFTAVVNIGMKLYIIINEHDKIIVWAFDLLTLIWTKCKGIFEQQFSKYEISAVAIEDVIYVFGINRPFQSSECKLLTYTPAKDKWSCALIYEPHYKIGRSCIVNIESVLHLLAITKEQETLALELSFYDPDTRTFNFLSELFPVPSDYYRAHIAGDKLYIRMNIRTLEVDIWIMYDIQMRKWTVMPRQARNLPSDSITSVGAFCGRKDSFWVLATDDLDEIDINLFECQASTHFLKKVTKCLFWSHVMIPVEL